MKLKTLLVVVVCAAAAIVAYRMMPDAPSTAQYKRIDAFYAQVESNPKDFPEVVRTAVQFIKEHRDKIPRPKETQLTDPEQAGLMMTTIRQQTTPEEFQAYETWEKAGGELAFAFNLSRPSGGEDPPGRHDTSRQYSDFVRKYLGAPMVCRETTKDGPAYYILEKNGERRPPKKQGN